MTELFDLQPTVNVCAHIPVISNKSDIGTYKLINALRSHYWHMHSFRSKTHRKKVVTFRKIDMQYNLNILLLSRLFPGLLIGIYINVTVVRIINVSQASLWNPYAHSDMWRVTASALWNCDEISWMTLLLTVWISVACLNLSHEQFPVSRRIISINVLRIINQHHHGASCLSVNDNDSFSLLQTRACDTACHCTSQSMDNASASLNEGTCQAFQREEDQTHEQFALLGNPDDLKFWHIKGPSVLLSYVFPLWQCT